MTLRVLDLFCGLGGFSKAFRDAGDEVVTLDFNPKFNPTHVMDIFEVQDLSELEVSAPFDVILSSPPCNCFSVASMHKHWGGGHKTYQPKTEEAKVAIRLMKHTFALVRDYSDTRGKYFILENPMGILRKIIGLPTSTIWYCQYGHSFAKPTDLWTNIDMDFRKCRNNNPGCGHERAPRGSRKGVNGVRAIGGFTAAEIRAEIPIGVSEAVREGVILGLARLGADYSGG